jgi:hypothetical protein
VLTWLKDNGLPLDRKHYISMAKFGQEDYDWTAEDEAGMPGPLRELPKGRKPRRSTATRPRKRP